jgi:signal transduction histidine kinase
LFLNAPAALSLMDASGAILDENRDWVRLAGGPGRRLATLAGEEAATRFLLAAISNGRAVLTFKSETGRVRLTGKRLRRASDEVPFVFLRAEDVTVEHELELLLTQRADAVAVAEPQPASPAVPEEDLVSRLEEAESKSQAKSDFIARLSHEMRNPLNAIIGFSDIMDQARFGALGDARYESYVRDIRTSAEHLMSLVSDLLDLSRIEAGQLKLAFEAVDIESLIEDCVRLMQPEAGRFGVTLGLAVPVHLPNLLADRRSMRQVLINLISNALKFTADGGHVTVAAEMDAGGEITLKVSDTGIGMSRGEVQLALEPFGQVIGPLQRHRQGTGLGLPIAKALTEANRAEFHIRSEPRRGTKVEIVFASDRTVAPKPVEAAPAKALG